MARRIYDNWQRLVEAVLRREQMLEIFHAQSRTPSISSIASDTSSSSSFDLSFNDAFSRTVKSNEKLESRKNVEEEILAALLHGDVDTIGIFGVGGIGKTRMAKRIGEIFKKEQIFDEIIVAVVGQQSDIEKIQSDIAEVLGLKFEEKNLQRVGKKAEDLDFQPLAKLFAKECKVPLALEILGSVLKEKEKPFWDDALVELRNCAPNYVYQPLKLSYTWLSDETKSLLLLCSLFKENSDIFLEDQVRFGMGLDMFDSIASLEAARSRVCDLTKILKDRFLLQEGCDQVTVKMHHVVRSVVISIASEANHDAKLISWAEKISYTHISLTSTESVEFPEGLVCPNRHFLMLQCNLNVNLVPDNLFDGMRELNVLVLSDINIKSVSSSFHLLIKLQTLHLHSCSVKRISMVGQLVNLEILSVYDCHGIEVLPAEIGLLSRLRLLELYQCKNLKKIAPGVISSLFLMEELKMRGSFAQWQASEKGQEKTNAALSELQFLSRLVNLEIEIEDPNVITTDIQPFLFVTKFCIKIGTSDCNIEVPHPYKIINHQQYLHLSLPKETTPGNWIHEFLRRTEDLTLIGNGLTNLAFQKFEKVKKLRLHHCASISHFLDHSSNEGVFRFLESLDLQDVTNLQELCHGPLPVGSFSNLRDVKLYEMPTLLHLWKNPEQTSPLINLKSIDIRNCKILCYLFTLPVARSLVHLEELRILFCGMMKEVLFNDLNSEVTGSIAFPRLKKLILNSLSSLMFFCRGIESMQFPQLEFFSIRNLPKLQGLLPGDGSFPGFFNPTVGFDSLKEVCLHGLDDTISQIWSLKIPTSHFSQLQKLQICACNKLKNLFSPSTARALVNLKELDIKDSLMMMQIFSLGFMSTPKLQHLEVDNELVEIKDFNGAIGRNFRAKLEHGTSSSSNASKRTGKEKDN
ncbi:hypothetical protein DH2020_041437 [Rehmannia glutinosa]|uniref:NB-ARC domain-containing protein n=1 Tax=Rehmannia glutinosa TaxID=99300 RepID=A0ABR0UQU5_REHGL